MMQMTHICITCGFRAPESRFQPKTSSQTRPKPPGDAQTKNVDWTDVARAGSQSGSHPASSKDSSLGSLASRDPHCFARRTSFPAGCSPMTLRPPLGLGSLDLPWSLVLGPWTFPPAARTFVPFVCFCEKCGKSIISPAIIAEVYTLSVFKIATPESPGASRIPYPVSRIQNRTSKIQ